MTTVTSLRLPKDILTTIQQLSEKSGRSKNWIISKAIQEYVEKEVGAEKRWRETLAALEAVRIGKIVEGEKVKSWLESWGTEQEKTSPQV